MEIQQITDLYLQGMSTIQIAKLSGHTRATIVKRLKKNDIVLRTVRERLRKYQLNETVFDGELSLEAIYWIGFLLADGNLYHRNNEYVIQIALAAIDKEHLEKFRDFLGSNRPIQEYQNSCKTGIYPACSISINSKSLFQKLESFGLAPRKSLNADIITYFIDKPDFWRGVIDGDGSYCIKPNHKISVILSPQMAEYFLNYIWIKYEYQACAFIHSMTAAMTCVQISKLEIIHRFIQDHYYDECVCLDRKLQIVHQLRDKICK